MKLHVGRRAEEQASKIGRWWRANRAHAPTLFADELEETLLLIGSGLPGGVSTPTLRHPTLRRILMPRTQNHVYFVIDEANDTVRVYAIWGASRGRAPRL